MGKGNFFKKNIKKRKKERKERGIRQRISEQKKKVEEKLHHVVEAVTEVQKAVEPVVEKQEPVVEKQEPVVEKQEPVVEKQEPVVEKQEESKMLYMIFDESIISYIMLDKRDVIEGIQSYAEKQSKFLTFDAVINSFIENERVTYNRILTFDQVISKLKKIGDFQYYGFDKESAIGQRASALFETEKYIDNSDILEEKKLSKTDCILIELLIDKSVILVTNNSLLKEAATQEAKERNVTIKIFDPLEL